MRLRALRPGAAPPGPLEPGPGPGRRPWPWRWPSRLPTAREAAEALRRNLGLKLLSLLLAFFLWFSTTVSDREAETNLEMPLRVDYLAPDLIVTNLPSRPVQVTVRGPSKLLDGLNERRSRIALDLGGATAGERQFELTAEMIRPEPPEVVRVARIEPLRVKVRVERLTRKRLPVRAELAGQPALGYTVVQTLVNPSEVEVSGPARRLQDLTEIKTEPVYLRRAAAPLEKTVLLSWPADFVTFTPDRVTVTVTLQEQLMSRVFENVEVTVRNAPADVPVQLTPRSVELTLRGPQRLLTAYRLPDGSVSVDAAGLLPGRHRVTPDVELPQGLEVTRREPEDLTVQIGERGRPAAGAAKGKR